MGPSSLVPVTINGSSTINGQPILVQAETTTGPILQQYANDLQVFNEIFNLSSATAQAQINTGTYNARIQAAIADLNNLAANGVRDPAQLDGFNNPARMNAAMADAMSRLYQTLTIAGIPTDGSPVTTAQVLNWRNYAYSTSDIKSAVNTVLIDATNSVGSNNASLQSLIQLVYVQEGNNIISSNLASLEQALSTTNNALTTLNNIQALANQKTVATKQSFRDYLTQQNFRDVLIDGFIDSNNGGNVFGASMQGFLMAGAASKFFAGVIPPTVTAALNNSINPYILQFLDYRSQLASEIQILSAISNDPTNSNSLLTTLKAVYSTMNTAISSNGNYLPNALKAWILDGQTISGDSVFGPSGSIQTKINNAMTAGQNLNSQQTESTRQYLFLFEQFYQSASSVLSTITSLISEMAKAAGR